MSCFVIYSAKSSRPQLATLGLIHPPSTWVSSYFPRPTSHSAYFAHFGLCRPFNSRRRCPSRKTPSDAGSRPHSWVSLREPQAPGLLPAAGSDEVLGESTCIVSRHDTFQSGTPQRIIVLPVCVARAQLVMVSVKLCLGKLQTWRSSLPWSGLEYAGVGFRRGHRLRTQSLGSSPSLHDRFVW